jgi:hypothetical protein
VIQCARRGRPWGMGLGTAGGRSYGQRANSRRLDPEVGTGYDVMVIAPVSEPAQRPTGNNLRDAAVPLFGAAVAAAFIILAGTAIARVDSFSSELAIGLVAAVVPGVISVVVAVIGHLDRRQAAAERESLRRREDQERESLRYEQIIPSSLDYFTGKTQRRNVGIAVLQGAWSKAPHLRSIFVPLLVNQALYLLEESEQEEARHERENLDRIMELVISSRSLDVASADTYQRLHDSLARRLNGTTGRKGVAVEADTLRAWLDALVAM